MSEDKNVDKGPESEEEIFTDAEDLEETEEERKYRRRKRPSIWGWYDDYPDYYWGQPWTWTTRSLWILAGCSWAIFLVLVAIAVF